jgi:tetratricopeptide (TPR) repeat protein
MRHIPLIVRRIGSKIDWERYTIVPSRARPVSSVLAIFLLALPLLSLFDLPTASGQVLDAWVVEHFGRAQRAQQENNLELAAEEYQLIVSREPKFAGAYLNLGIVRHQQRRYTEAVKVLRTAVALDPRALGGQLFLGIDEYLAGDPQSAVPHLEAALEIDHTNREAGIYLGLAYSALNKPLVAVATLRATAQYHPNDADICYRIGQAYLEASQQASAELKEFGDQTAPYHWALAIGAEQKNDSVTAIQEYMRALACDPGIAELYLRLAILCQKSGYPYLASAALQRLKVLDPNCQLDVSSLPRIGVESERAESVAPENVVADNQVGFRRLWDEIPSPDESHSGPVVADRFVNRALTASLASPAGVALKKALQLYSSGDYKGAAAEISRSKLSNTNWAAAYLLALAYLHAADYDDAAQVLGDRLLPYLKVPSVSLLSIEVETWLALTYLAQVTAIRPNSYMAKMLQADYYAASSQYKEALAAYQEALKLAPDRLGIHLALGKVYESQFQWQPAIAEFRAEVELDPSNQMALAHLGHALTEARDPVEAIPILERLLRTNPQDGQGYADLGKAYEIAGRTEEAISAYHHATLTSPTQIDVHYRLFQLYRRVGKEDEAKKELALFKADEAQKHESYLRSMDDLK